MAPLQNYIALAVLLSSAAISFIAAQAPPPQPDCFQALVNLSDCLTFFEKGSKLEQPDPGCCPGLSNLVRTQSDCFCKLLGGGQIPMPIDSDRARDLPAACHVSNSSSNCFGQGAPPAVEDKGAPPAIEDKGAPPAVEDQGAPSSPIDGAKGEESSANTLAAAPTPASVTPASEDISFAGISKYYAIDNCLLIGLSALILSYLSPMS